MGDLFRRFEIKLVRMQSEARVIDFLPRLNAHQNVVDTMSRLFEIVAVIGRHKRDVEPSS